MPRLQHCSDERCGGTLTYVEDTDGFGRARTSYYVCSECSRRVEAGE